MKWLATLSISVLAGLLLAQPAIQVDQKGFVSKVRFERVVAGHLTELNGKYKMRVSETTYAPKGYIGNHQHVGPGIRFIESGELTYVIGDTTRVYKAGDYFFEPGDVTHSGYNKSDKPLVIINFEILPADWSTGSAVPPPAK